MKLKPDFITYNTETEHMLVPAGTAGFSGLVRGNKTLGVILELLKEETSEEAVIAAMGEHFDAPEDVIRNDVKKALSELRRIGAIEE